MDAVELLKEDHRAVDELFKRVEDTPPSKHPPIFKRIKNELDTHAHIEEKVFYPALKAKGNKELVDITMEGFEEHAQIKKFLKEIARSTSKDKREAKLKVLMEDTRHHVKEEEDEMFPMVKDQFSPEEREALGQRMEAERTKFQKAKKIAARPAPPKSTVAKVIEKAKDLVTSAFTGSSTSEAKLPPKKQKAAASRKSSPVAKRGNGSNGRASASSKAKTAPPASKTVAKPKSPKKSSGTRPSSKARA